MYLLLLDKLYSLRLWSEQTRQMNLPRLQKLCKPMSCCPGYQGFFFSRVRRGASFRRPQADTCRAGHLTEIGNRAWKASATQSNVLLKVLLRSNLGICFWLHISSSRLTLRICGTQQYQCRLPSKVSKVQIRLTFAAWNKLLFRDLYNNAKF